MTRAVFDRVAVLAAASLVLVGALTAPARPASTDQQQDAVTAYLEAHPGGTRTGPDEISYDNGTFIVTVKAPKNALGGPDCPSGWFCFYDRTYYGYPRGRLSDCGWQDLAEWGWEFRTESVHYNMSSGSVRFYYYATELFRAGTGRRTLPDVSPDRNWANLVRRVC
jgi:hypothetical protein